MQYGQPKEETKWEKFKSRIHMTKMFVGEVQWFIPLKYIECVEEIFVSYPFPRILCFPIRGIFPFLLIANLILYGFLIRRGEEVPALALDILYWIALAKMLLAVCVVLVPAGKH